LNDRIFSWRDADEHDAFAGGKSGPVGRHKRVLAVDAFERHEGDVTVVRKLLDGRDQAVVSRFE
jgi:hypothetical protein